MSERKAGTGGEHYIPYSERTGNESIVYFTRDLSPEGIAKVYEQVCHHIGGKVAIKLHTGEPHGPNIIPPSWVKEFMQRELPDATIIETNTFYDGDRSTTERHRKTLEINGWTSFTTVDITDEHGTAMLPVHGGKWFTEMSVGASLPTYDSLVVLTHFKGHLMGGFGGSNKNIGIGCADGKIGKGMVHGKDSIGWGAGQEELMEHICESTKSVLDHFGDKAVFINVMRNMSVSCDCEGVAALPVTTPNVGILASVDILAADQASVDMIQAMEEKDKHDLIERIESRHGYRQLTYMKELGMGNDRYVLIDLDNGGARIDAAQAVAGVVPFQG